MCPKLHEISEACRFQIGHHEHVSLGKNLYLYLFIKILVKKGLLLSTLLILQVGSNNDIEAFSQKHALSTKIEL